MKPYIFILMPFFILFSCTEINENELLFKKVDLNRDNRIVIDTIKIIEDRDIAMLLVKKYWGIDDFTPYLTIAKGNNLSYEIQNKGKYGLKLSDEYLAFVDGYGFDNSGWFSRKGSKFSKLNKIDSLLDSLRIINQEYFIRECNGIITFFQSGDIKKTMNYGDFILTDQDVNIDRLAYGLYEYKDGALNIISDDGNDIEKQIDGIFYIPSPGYGVITKFKVEEIINAVDSVFKLKDHPLKFKLKK